LSVPDDWAPCPKEIDIVERSPVDTTEPLRAILEDIGFKVNRTLPRYGELKLNRFLRGGRFDAPFMILNVRGAGKGGKRGIFLSDHSVHLPVNRPLLGPETFLPEDIAKSRIFRDKAILCLGEGLGTWLMADAFFQAGATAYIGTTGADPGRTAPRLFFLIRFFHEIGWNQATVREAWERAVVNDRETRKFRLYMPTPGTRRAVVVPAPRSAGWMKALLPRIADPKGRTDWRPPVNEVDLLTSIKHPADDPKFVRMILEHWGMKVNLCPFRDEGKLKYYLSGRGLKAPVVALLSHGFRDRKGKWGIVMGPGRRFPEARIFDAARISRIINLRGRVLLALSCRAEERDAAAAFLKGGLRAYIAGGDYAHTKQIAMFQFFYELAVNKATIRQAVERAAIGSYSPGLLRLFPGGTKAPALTAVVPSVIRAPALIEGFEGNTGSGWECDYDIGFFDITPGRQVPAPGGRPGLAFRLNFDFAQKQWAELLVTLSPAGHRWAGVRGISLDTYVPYALRLRRPLKFLFCLAGDRHEYVFRDLVLKRGWNTVKITFAAPGWEGKVAGEKEWRPEAFDLTRLQPVRKIWIALPGTGRREAGSVFFDNFRLENKP